MAVSTGAATLLEGASAGFSTKLASSVFGFDAACAQWGAGGGTGAALGMLLGAGKIRAAARAASTGVKVATRGGESAAASFGRRAHKEFDYGPGFEKEFRNLPSKRRPDAVNVQERVVVELKPNSPAAIRRGQRQVERYRQELEAKYGGTWTARLETYDRP